jgi:putative transposase
VNGESVDRPEAMLMSDLHYVDSKYIIASMIITHCYRIKPSAEQEAVMFHTLELLRRHWNYALGQRLDWLRRTRCQIDRCSIVSEPIGVIPGKVDYYTQQSDLKQTKVLFPEYKGIWAESQQVNLQRLKKAWERWMIPDASGKRGGRPRFKKQGELRSFVYPRVNDKKAGAHLNDGILKLSKIGSMPVVMHRPLPDGFVLKTCTIVRKADGWYCCISMQDEAVPLPMPVEEIKSATAIDVGLEKFLATAQGNAVPVPHFYRKAQARLARAQRRLARQKKGSINWEHQKNRIALLHLKVARCREEFHYQVSHWLCQQYDLISFENLNIKGLARTRLAKSILDCAWGAFLQILQAVAVKRGKRTVEVSARGSSIECSGCGERVEKTLKDRVHNCPSCLLKIDRDWNSALVLLDRGLRTVGLPFSGCGGLEVTQPVRQQFSIVKLEAPVITAQAV